MKDQKDQPLISVVIPVKNGAATLASCLEGIRAQTLGDRLEIIVIDSGSTDGSLELLSHYPVKVHRIPKEEFNHGETRNLGVRLARGAFVAMTVQDARPVDNRWLERMVKHFDDPKVAGVCGQQVVPHELDKNPLQWFRPYSQPVLRKVSFANPADFKNLPPTEQVMLCGWDDVTAMYRRSALLEIPFRRVNFSEDAIWARDALAHGLAIIYDYSAKVYHYHSETFLFRFRRQFTSRYQLHVYFDYLTLPPSLIMDLTRCAFRSAKRRISPEHRFKWFLYNARLHTANWAADWIYWMSAKCAGLQTCSSINNRLCPQAPQPKMEPKPVIQAI